jgi:hypothetical protein
MNQNASAEQLLNEGIIRFHNGDRQAAFELIEQAAQHDPRNLEAWLWLAGLAQDRDQRIYYLNQVLLIEPTNQRALQALETLRLAQTPHSLDQLLQIPPGLLADMNRARQAQNSAGQATVVLPQPSSRFDPPLGFDNEELVVFIRKQLNAKIAKDQLIAKVTRHSDLNAHQSELLIDYIARKYNFLSNTVVKQKPSFSCLAMLSVSVLAIVSVIILFLIASFTSFKVSIVVLIVASLIAIGLIGLCITLALNSGS